MEGRGPRIGRPEGHRGGTGSDEGRRLDLQGHRGSFQDRVSPPYKSSFKLDPSKSPKEIDLIGLDGPQKGKTMQGIYRLEDGRADHLRSRCRCRERDAREFATEAG